MKRALKIFLPVLLVVAASAWYLFRPISNAPGPARFVCLHEEDGYFVDFDTLPRRIYGFGLSYAQHIAQTSVSYDPDAMPPVFIKDAGSVIMADGVAHIKIPSITEMQQAMAVIEKGLDKIAFDEVPGLQPLLDYEVELGMIVLEDIAMEDLDKKEFMPKLGFFIANDISERAIAVLGDGQPNTYDYWGISKSFAGFTPLPGKYWVPKTFRKNQIPCIRIQTTVNGKLRQSEITSNMIYTPEQLLKFISKKYHAGFYKGDVILSGTPGGTAIHAPRWKLRIGKLLGVDRFFKLKNVMNGDQSAYLKHGDEVRVSGEWLGTISVQVQQ